MRNCDNNDTCKSSKGLPFTPPPPGLDQTMIQLTATMTPPNIGNTYNPLKITGVLPVPQLNYVPRCRLKHIENLLIKLF